MPDLHIRIEGRAGRITLTRPEALNALTYAMCVAIDAALQDWATAGPELILIDAQGTRAFCSGGDIAEMYATGRAGDFAYGQRFWRDEYRMNARLAAYPKPVISFLQGYTMGGGVGVGCHAGHRIVGESSRIAMPECGIGLVPDVGGSYLLARAPGHLGAYLGCTAARMGPGDAILAGFADHFLPEAGWAALKTTLIADGDIGAIAAAARPAPDSALAALCPAIDRNFGDTLAPVAAPVLAGVLASLRADPGEFARDTLKLMARNSPLAMACALEMQQRLRGASLAEALELEYRFTARAMARGDFLEGIRAAIIDKDRTPHWHHALDDVPAADIAAMLAPLPD